MCAMYSIDMFFEDFENKKASESTEATISQ
jgi:hypothetical protein